MATAAYVTLALVPGVGRVRFDQLLRRFGSAERVLEADHQSLSEVPGVTRAAATAIRRARLEAGRAVLEDCERLHAVALAPADPRFPPALRPIPDAPVLLFATGNLGLLKADGVAVVGSRDHTAYGAAVAADLATAAARAGLTVVSGMARGLDAVAHAAALDSGGPTVGVLGNGLGVVYPAANRALYEAMGAKGCLLTEHPPGERPHAGSFPRRNRLISGLARATVVIEARAGSGALITADCALAQGRDVLAVPGPITSPLSLGTNRLIHQGATPVLDPADVLTLFGLGDPGPQLTLPADLTDAERQTLDALAAGVDRVDLLTRRLNLGAGHLLAVLTALEIRGLVRPEAGPRFVVAGAARELARACGAGAVE